MEADKHKENKKVWTTWFEIPVTDFDRAKEFYENIFETPIEKIDFGSLLMGIFPHHEVGCALCKGPGYIPSEHGPLVYMDAGPDLQHVLDRVEHAGGKVMRNKSQISEDHGYMALFIDSEGNRMALHSMK